MPSFQSSSPTSSAPDPARKTRDGFLMRSLDCAALKTSLRIAVGEFGSVHALGGRRSGARCFWLVLRAIVIRVGGRLEPCEHMLGGEGFRMADGLFAVLSCGSRLLNEIEIDGV